MNRLRLCLVLMALFVVPLKSFGLALVVPAESLNDEGNSNNRYPFAADFGMRYQQIYGASAFESFHEPLSILGIAFRADGPLGVPFTVEHPQIDLKLSRTAKAPDTLSATFADNVGPDETTVYSGPLVISSTAPGPSGGPRAFDIEIPFSTPFTYDPAAGSLLLDVLTPGILGLTELYPIDAQDSPGDSISRVWGGSSDSIGILDPFTGPSAGLITRFTLAPEPSAITLIVVSGLVALGSRRRSIPHRQRIFKKVGS
ncbi:MAG: hypothetical protein AB7G28_20865 [Pirellulales bacterium]